MMTCHFSRSSFFFRWHSSLTLSYASNGPNGAPKLEFRKAFLVNSILSLLCSSRLENDRIGKIRATFTSYSGILESIAHLMPEDVSRILDAEATIINATIINNSRAYGDLFMRLMTADIEV